MLVLQLCREQRRAGLAPEVHWLLKRGPLADVLSNEGFPVRGHGGEGVGAWQIELSLLRALSPAPDVVHSHNANAAILCALPAALRRIPHVCTRHGLVPPDAQRSRERKFWLAARLLRRVIAVCRVAHNNLARGQGAQPAKIVTIRNGACPAVRSSGASVPKKTGVVAIAVARLSPAKDQACLLRALAVARRQAPELSLWIVGDGPERGALERLRDELALENAVVFCGEQLSVGNFLDAADLFVLSSVSEGLPVSLLEAMEAGLPQVVTRVGGMPEVVELAASGSLVEAGDYEAMGRALAALAASTEARQRMGANAKDAYRKHFRISLMHEQYLELYQGIGANPRRQSERNG